jgi:uncharacterized protein with GYD domain
MIFFAKAQNIPSHIKKSNKERRIETKKIPCKSFCIVILSWLPCWFKTLIRRRQMATYIMLSTLTDEGRKTVKMRPERIKEVNKELEKMGVRVVAQYAVLGPYDFINVVEAPDNETISKVSIDLGSRGTVQLMTLVAIPIDEFEQGLKEG